ncbi:hypothetical protein EFY87_08585 [Flexivirga caeni]|uniref:Uncharacterized protein n=1 Tax=Flexivirga caeni TaxID=2294115 RepID=A0A3M9MBD1_9MICO|nr:hypothetical protein EFY87_08585 [Flexivirga caeni]
MVLPEYDAVLAMTAETTQMQAVLDAAWDHLLPGLDAGGSCTADEELAGRLSCAAVRIPGDDASGTDTTRLVRDGGDAAPKVDAVSIEIADDGWVAVFHAGERRWELPVGKGTWAAGEWKGDPGVPFRSAGGWVSGRFRAELRMIRTPHVIQLVADRGAGTAQLRWREQPLHGCGPGQHSIQPG